MQPTVYRAPSLLLSGAGEGLFCNIPATAGDLLCCYPPEVKPVVDPLEDESLWCKTLTGPNEVETLSGKILLGVVRKDTKWSELAPLANDPYLAPSEAELFLHGCIQDAFVIMDLVYQYIKRCTNDYPGKKAQNSILGPMGDDGVALYATRPIKKDEEITCAYGIAYWLEAYTERLRLRGYWTMGNEIRNHARGYLMARLKDEEAAPPSEFPKSDHLKKELKSLKVVTPAITDAVTLNLSAVFFPPQYGYMVQKDTRNLIPKLSMIQTEFIYDVKAFLLEDEEWIQVKC
jgi:hypothetical protein